MWRATGPQEFSRSAMSGLVPLLMWLMCVFQTFVSTEWAWRNPSLAMILLLPSFSEINSKMIINNVTNMETQVESRSFLLWFFIFPLNRQNEWVPEWVAAAVIFGITFTNWMVFVVSTIG